MTTGENIKKARLNAGLTQAQLARLVGTTTQNISQYERNIRNPKFRTAEKIAIALGASPVYDNGIIDFEPLPKINLIIDYQDSYKNAQTKISISLMKLNDAGREKAIERVQELTEIPKYKADE